MRFLTFPGLSLAAALCFVMRHVRLGIEDSSMVRAMNLFIGLWLERQFRDRKVAGPQERREDFLVQGQLSVRTLISVSVLPQCYCSSTLKITIVLPKVKMEGYS